MSSGQNMHICYAGSIVHGCSAAIMLAGIEGKVRLSMKKRPWSLSPETLCLILDDTFHRWAVPSQNLGGKCFPLGGSRLQKLHNQG